MGIPISSNFSLNSQLPLDARTVVANITARDLIPSIQRYEGMVVYTDATNTNYQLQGGITNSNWVDFGTIPDASYTVRGAVNTGDQTFGGVKTLQGSSATDRPAGNVNLPLGTGTGTNWTGTNFITGYTHTVGSTAPLVTTVAATYRDFYSLYWTVTGRTAGSFTITFGGQTVYPIGINPPTANITATSSSGVRATNTNVFTITPTSDFNGTISFPADGVISSPSAFRNLPILKLVAGSRTAASSYAVDFRVSDGFGNFFVGYNAGGHNIFGSTNNGIGYQALSSGINTSQVNAIGGYAFTFLVGGTGNIGIGGYAGNQVGTAAITTVTNEAVNLRYADYSTFLGYDCRALDNNQTNQIVIGNFVTGLGSNTTSIGSSATTLTGLYGSLKLLGGYGSGTKTGTATYGLAIDSSGNVIEVALGGGGGGTTETASNGLTKVGNDIQLGGNLTNNRTINAASNTFKITGAPPIGQFDGLIQFEGNGGGTSNPTVKITNNAAVSSSALSVENIAGGGGIATYGTTYGIGASGNIGGDFNGFLTTSPAIRGSNNVLSAGNVIPLLELNYTPSGQTAGNGLSIDLKASSSTVGNRLLGQIISKWTNTTDATRTSEFSVTGVNSGTTNVLLQISGAGIFTLTQGLQNFIDDTTAAIGGIQINQLYRNGSIVMIRVS